MAQYRFGSFIVSPRRRVVIANGRELPLIPRYFDLLVFLLERRHEAVHRREIFDRVWEGVIVSDSALTQAIRTLRRTLDDDPREPRFIRTVSRHGYQFVCPDVVEEDEAWDAPAADAAPLPARTGETAAAADTVALQLRRTGRAIAAWSAAGALGGGASGLAAGLIGGAILVAAPDSRATAPLVSVLAVIGAVCGALGGSGVAAGLWVAEAAPQPRRTWAFVGLGAAGGAVAGLFAQWLGGATLVTLLGIEVPLGGGLEGVLIGASAGLGYGLPVASLNAKLVGRRGTRRLRVAALAVACGTATLALTATGRPLVGETIHRIALSSEGSQATLAPLGTLVGEGGFGPVSRTLVGTGEGVLFGIGLAWGLGRRPLARP